MLLTQPSFTQAPFYCPALNSFFLPSIPDMASTFLRQSVTSSLCKRHIWILIYFFNGVSYFVDNFVSAITYTFSSSFFTVLRLALKSDFMCLEVSVHAPTMSSVVFFTLFKLGLFMPFSPTIF